MRRSGGAGVILGRLAWWGRVLTVGLLATAAGACSPQTDGTSVPGRSGVVKSASAEKAERRLFDGAPPVIPHQPFGAGCISCHTEYGIAVPDIGFSPPSPHVQTAGMSAISRCRQCHVFRQTDGVFVRNSFAGLRQDLRRGRRLNAAAPPVIPHQVFMRENCVACHSGAAAREEIRTPHADRVRCRQCHVEQRTTTLFPPQGP